MQVLLVDDDNDILQSVRMGLEREGFEVNGFTDSIQAMDHIEKGCKDCQVIISDIGMPNINGIQLVRRVKELHPEMKVIMITAFEVSMPEFHAVFPSTPVDNVVRKPFLPSKLAEMIKKLLPIEKAA
jgi:DNA-binding NtrC family response regulator